MIPDVSYLILNYNPDGESLAQDVLGETVDRFFDVKSRNLTCDVYLMDQGSTEAHSKWLLERQRQHRFSLILLNRNIGISRAINYFVRTCKSPVVALLTSDVLTTRGMDEDLYRLVQTPEVFQATPFTDKSDVDYQRWQPKEAFGIAEVDLDGLQKTKKPLSWLLGNKTGREYLRVVGVELTVMFWRKTIFEKVGYFDERWKASYENNDFSLRCFLAGGCTAISFHSFAWHYHKVTEKNKSRDRSHDHYVTDWPREMRKKWDEKWPGLNKYIDIYKPLRGKTIEDYHSLYDAFRHNIFLPFEQHIEYF